MKILSELLFGTEEFILKDEHSKLSANTYRYNARD